MKRGEIWTVAGGAAYAGRPRPAVIVQDDRLRRLLGSLASEEVKALNRAIFVFLGLAETEASQD